MVEGKRNEVHTHVMYQNAFYDLRNVFDSAKNNFTNFGKKKI